MGMLDSGGMAGGLPPMEVNPRVFVRTPGEEYVEIAGVQSFERNDDAGGTTRISFVAAEDQDGAVRALIDQGPDKYVDVKMEFMIGMLMVMSFSGFVDSYSGGKVSFAVSTPVATDVVDVAQ